MRKAIWLACLLVCVIGVWVWSDPPTTAPTTQRSTRQVRLVLPWRDMTTLTDEQKLRIYEIHRQALAAKKAIDEKERADILALMNDQNLAELNDVESRRAAERKQREAERRLQREETDE
jgi:hypothetical protein